MRQRAIFTGRVLALALCAAMCLIAAARASAQMPGYPQPPATSPQTPTYPDQNQPKGQPKEKGAPSDAEVKAAQAVQSAADVQATAAAASEFVKKYPKSSLRPQVARGVATKIAAVPDPAQRVTLAEGALKLFDKPAEMDIINPVLISAYVEAKRFDEAFRVVGATLDKSPDDVPVRTQMALIGIDQARLGNAKFVPQSQQYAVKAIELIFVALSP